MSIYAHLCGMVIGYTFRGTGGTLHVNESTIYSKENLSEDCKAGKFNRNVETNGKRVCLWMQVCLCLSVLVKNIH